MFSALHSMRVNKVVRTLAGLFLDQRAGPTSHLVEAALSEPTEAGNTGPLSARLAAYDSFPHNRGAQVLNGNKATKLPSRSI